MELVLFQLLSFALDVGASKLIVEKSIRLKNDSTIREVDESGLIFSDDSYLPADVIVFATGCVR